MAKRGLPSLATYRPIGSPLGRRTFGHWPHTTGCHSGQKGEAGLRLQATYGHRPPTGQRRGRPPIGKRAPLPLTGHLLAIRGGPTGPPLATKGRERNFVRPSLTYGAPAPTGHLREPKTDLAK